MGLPEPRLKASLLSLSGLFIFKQSLVQPREVGVLASPLNLDDFWDAVVHQLVLNSVLVVRGFQCLTLEAPDASM